jgi:hypothetical protein
MRGVHVHASQVLTLLLAVSAALNLGFSGGIIARLGGASRAQAILTGGGVTGSVLALFFAALAAYH